MNVPIHLVNTAGQHILSTHLVNTTIANPINPPQISTPPYPFIPTGAAETSAQLEKALEEKKLLLLEAEREAAGKP